jgi:hypothetical protein
MLKILLIFLLSLSGEEGAKYLIITPDEFVQAVKPLAEWKTKKGMLSKIVPLSITGDSAEGIKAYIQNAYENWDIKPEFVLLCGSASYIPFYFNFAGTDNYYANLDEDPFNDIFVGRFPAENMDEVTLMVEKTLSYERYPDIIDPDWFKSATLIVRNDFDDDDSIYFADIYEVASRMVEAGFIHIDTLISAPPWNNNAEDVIDALNSGRNFVLYRGQAGGNWWTPFAVDPFMTSNGSKLPIIVSATCLTVSPYPDFTAVGEEWMRAGSSFSLKGAVGFFGTTTVRSGASSLRSAIARGFFRAIFEEGLETFGEIAEAARLYLYELYQDQYDYEGFITLGDPELRIWTDTPGSLSVSHPENFPLTGGNFVVTVSKEGVPLEGATVCLMMDSTLYHVDTTDFSGIVNPAIYPLHPGTLYVTVTAKNSIPYEGYTLIASLSSPYISLVSYSIQDDGGNGNGFLNPGETVFLEVVIENTGGGTAYGLSGILTSESEGITLLDSFYIIGNLSPQDSASAFFSFQVVEGMPNGSLIQFDLHLYDLSQSWDYTFDIPVFAPIFSVERFYFSDSLNGESNFVSEPGETLSLYIRLTNNGGEISSGFLHLYGNGPIGVIDSSIFFGPVSPSDSIWLTPLRIRIDPSAPLPSISPISVMIRSDFGNEFFDTIPIPIGGVFFDDFELMEGGWEHIPGGAGFNDEWHKSQSRFFSGEKSWKCGGMGLNPYSDNDDALLISPLFYLPPGSYLFFRHYMDAETSSLYGVANDGGIVEIQIEGGEWEIITPVSGYPYVTSVSNPLPPGTPIYSGNIFWEYAVFDLTDYSGWARIRFRFTSDGENVGEGWYIDDVLVSVPELCQFPIIEIYPLSFNFSLYPDWEVTDTLYISNEGSIPLTFNLEVLDDSTSGGYSWLTCNPTNGTISPDSLTKVEITVNSHLPPGDYYSKIIVHSNDPFDSVLTIPVTLSIEEVSVDEVEGTHKNFYIRPNPFRNRFQLSFYVKRDGRVDVRLFDVTGRIVKEVFSKKMGRGHFRGEINLGELKRGVYFLKIDSGDFSIIRKLVKI